MYIFPGMGLGIVCSRASRVTDRMFGAAARTLASQTPAGSLYPPLREIRRISAAIAFEVAREAMAAGLAEPCDEPVLRERIAAAMWEPRYLPYRPAPGARSRAEAPRPVP